VGPSDGRVTTLARQPFHPALLMVGSKCPAPFPAKGAPRDLTLAAHLPRAFASATLIQSVFEEGMSTAAFFRPEA